MNDKIKEGDIVFQKSWGFDWCDDYSYVYITPFKDGHLVSSSEDIKETEMWYVEDVKPFYFKTRVKKEEIAKWKGVPLEQIEII